MKLAAKKLAKGTLTGIDETCKLWQEAIGRGDVEPGEDTAHVFDSLLDLRNAVKGFLGEPVQEKVLSG